MQGLIKLKDHVGEEHECRYLIEYASYQPKTREVFWCVMAVGYDGIRRTDLFYFNTEEEMHRKYMELREEWLRQVKEQLKYKLKDEWQ